MGLPIRNANRAFVTFISSLAVVFAALFVILNMMLTQLIIEPIAQLSGLADQISRGKVDVPELVTNGGDEVSHLSQSFNRMRRSLQKALSLIEKG
jgi:nitrogen fixation/metabolism regulation signal transduction histidine kinase